MSGSARAMLAGAALSVVLHAFLAYVLPSLQDVRRALASERAADVELDLRFEPAGDGSITRTPGDPSPALPGGGDAAHNVDARDRGQGGDETGSQQVVNLLPRADEITLTDAPMNAVGVGQTQRIDTARDRASAEDRRATPNPEDDPFLASGSGEHPERRPIATIDPRAGARVAPQASTAGAPLTGSASALTAARTGAGATTSGVDAAGPSGSVESSPGRGILEGRGARGAESARVAHGRPTVDQARAATTTEARDARTRDDVDAELLAARMMQSVVEATERRGRIEGDGRGGALALGAPGVGGGSAEGGRARSLGPGRGAFDALDTGDERYRRWFVDLRRRVERHLEFPHERELAMDQGTSVYVLLVRRDGSLARAPRLIRSSGFDDLDGAALAAIQRAAPLAPLPDDLAPGRATFEVRLPIELSNPMVR